jgi:GTP-binding protein HflX
MFELKLKATAIQRAMIVGICFRQESPEQTGILLEELADLVDTLGIRITEKRLIRCAKPQSRFLVGSGKAEEIVAAAKGQKADVIIFDQAITPAQQRNWEKLSSIAVIDREEVILDIFAKRARTREAILQVELARMQYSLPRLTRAWTHLSRQGGTGFGAMGAGETQLETDRRIVRKRIDKLQAELKDIHRQRATRRKLRQRHAIPHVAIVGYTNAGKSSLFRQMSGENVFVEDKLFATLDTTTRQVALSDEWNVLLTDTVGFVRKLPHHLVESFKATLEEAVISDALVHLLDASQTSLEELSQVTLSVLEELGANLKTMLTVFNKIDLVTDKNRIASIKRLFPQALFISAETGEGIAELKLRLIEVLHSDTVLRDYLFPHTRYDLVSSLHREGQILEELHEGKGIRLRAKLPLDRLEIYEAYCVLSKTRKNGARDSKES